MRALVLLGSLAAARAYTGYAVGPDALSYQAAVSYCVSVGGEIASIHSDADNEAARDACGDNVCWIGLRESGGEAGTHAFEQIWRWPDNSTAGADSYHNWAPGEPDYSEYYDERHAVMNEGHNPQYNRWNWRVSTSGLWFAIHSDTWSTYVPLCGVNAPTTAPTLSPAPTSSPKPTSSFSCDNDKCGVSGNDECCHSSWDEPVCSGGYVPVEFGDHDCLFTCCTVAVTHEEVTASGHQWEDHAVHSDDWDDDWGGGSGGGWALFIFLYLLVFSGVPAIITAIIACICVRCGCCKSCLPPKLKQKDLAATPPTVPSGVELTAPPAQVYKASIVASEGV